MNAFTTQFDPKSPDDVLLLVRLANVSIPSFLPENNRIATLMLCELLRLNMEADGVVVVSTHAFMPLNRGALIFRIASSLQVAVGSVIEKLETLALAKTCQIVSISTREGTSTEHKQLPGRIGILWPNEEERNEEIQHMVTSVDAMRAAIDAYYKQCEDSSENWKQEG